MQQDPPPLGVTKGQLSWIWVLDNNQGSSSILERPGTAVHVLQAPFPTDPKTTPPFSKQVKVSSFPPPSVVPVSPKHPRNPSLRRGEIIAGHSLQGRPWFAKTVTPPHLARNSHFKEIKTLQKAPELIPASSTLLQEGRLMQAKQEREKRKPPTHTPLPKNQNCLLQAYKGWAGSRGDPAVCSYG